MIFNQKLQYIKQITLLLDDFNADMLEAIYLTLRNFARKEHKNGLSNTNNRVSQKDDRPKIIKVDLSNPH